MATFGEVEKVHERYDCKLYSLLKRELSTADYEQILYVEICVYLSQKGSRAHGYAVIGPGHLYFVPVPIKRGDIRTIIKITDIISMTLVNDEPGFLLGKFKENTLHLIFNYRQSLVKTPPTSPSHFNTTPTRTLTASLFKSRGLINVFHLYLLKTETQFVTYMNLHLEDVQVSGLSSMGDQFFYVLDKETCIQRYHSLKADIMGTHSIEESVQLYIELSTAFQRYFQIKLLFWQDDGELLRHCIRDMKRVHDTVENALEYNVIVTEVMLGAFQGTLVSKGRLSVLMNNNAQLVTDLCHLLMTIFSKELLTCSDVESLNQLTSNCSGIFYEISRVIQHQTRPAVGRNSSLTSSISNWSDNMYHSPHYNMGVFIDRLIIALCEGLSYRQSSTDHISSHVIQGRYKMVSLLLVWVTHSHSILDTCRVNYSEEFLYRLTPERERSPLIGDKLRQLQSLVLHK